MRHALLISVAATACFAADNAAPTPESVVKEYAQSFNRLTKQPKSISAEFAVMCGSVVADKTHGPHSRGYVHHYRNPLAMRADGGFAPGSVLVKEKFRAKNPFKPDAAELEAAGLTGMIKLAPGASPKTGDWQFFECYEGKFVTANTQSCAGCHSGAPRDHVFTKLPAAGEGKADRPSGR